MSQESDDEVGRLKAELAQKEKDIQMKDIALKGTSGLRAKLNAAEGELQKMREGAGAGAGGGVDPVVFKEALDRSEKMYTELEHQQHKYDVLCATLLELKESHSKQESRTSHLLDNLNALPAPASPTPDDNPLEPVIDLLLTELLNTSAEHETELSLASSARRDEASSLNFTISTLEVNERAAASGLYELNNQLEKEILRTAKAQNETKKVEQALAAQEETAKKLNAKTLKAATRKLEKLGVRCTDLEEENLKLQVLLSKSNTELFEKEELINSLEERVQAAEQGAEAQLPSIEVEGATPKEPEPPAATDFESPEAENSEHQELQCRYEEVVLEVEKLRMLLKERENDLQIKTEEFECLQGQVQQEREAVQAESIDKETEEEATGAYDEQVSVLTAAKEAEQAADDLSAKLAAALEAIRSLEAREQKGEDALGNLRDKYSQLEEEKNALKQELQSRCSQIEEENGTLTGDLQSKFSQLEEENDALKQELQSKCTQLQEEKDAFARELQTKCSQLEEEKQELQNKCSQFEEENNAPEGDLQTKCAQLEEENDALKQELQSKCSQPQEENDALVRDLQTKCSQLEEENDAIKQELQSKCSLEEENNALEGDLQTKCSQLEEQNDALKQELQTKCSQLEEENDEIKQELQRKCSQLEEENNALKQELQTKCSQLEEQNAALKQDLESAASASADAQLAGEYERCTAELERYRSASDDMREELEESRKMIKEMTSELERNHEELESSVSEVAAMRTQLEQCKADLTASESQLNANAAHESDLQSAREELRQAAAELEAKTAELSRSNSELEVRSTELEGIRAAREEDERRHEAAASALREERQCNTERMNERDLYREEAEVLRARVATLEEDARVVLTLRTELTERNEAIESITQQLSDQKQRATTTQEDLMKSRDEMAQKERDLQDLVAAKDGVIQVLRGEVSAHEVTVHEKLVDTEASYTARLDAAQRSTINSEEENRKLKEDVVNLRSTMDRLREEIAGLHDQSAAQESKQVKEMELELLTSQKEGESLKAQLAEARAAVVAGMAEATRRVALEKKISSAEGEMKRQNEVGAAELRQQLKEARAAVAVGMADSAKLQAQLRNQSQQETAALTIRLEETQSMFHAAQRECQSLRQELQISKDGDHEVVTLQTKTKMMEEELARKDRQLIDQSRDMEEIKRAGEATGDEKTLRKELAACRRDMMKLGHTHRELLAEFDLVRAAKKHAEKKLGEQLSNPSLYKLVRTMKGGSPVGDVKKVETLAGHLTDITSNHHMTEGEVDNAVLLMLERRISENTTLICRMEEVPSQPTTVPLRPITPVRTSQRRYQSPALHTSSRTPRASTNKPAYVQVGPILQNENPGRTPSINRRMSPGRYTQGPSTPRSIWR